MQDIIIVLEVLFWDLCFEKDADKNSSSLIQTVWITEGEIEVINLQYVEVFCKQKDDLLFSVSH